VVDGDCWDWPLARTTAGYGELVYEGELRYAHRLTMELRGHDLDGKVVRHACDNPSCVNPEHLLVGSHSENQRDSDRRNEDSLRTKLSPADVDDIRAEYDKGYGGTSQSDLAEEYGVTRSQVGRIVREEVWI